jgi:hypothetical protein
MAVRFAPGIDKKQDAMKKLLATALLGTFALAISPGQASAGWLSCLCCKKGCTVTLTARQYNAFSPYCFDNLNGCIPIAGYGCGPQGGCAVNGGTCLGELPTTMINGAKPVEALPQGQPVPAQTAPHAWQQWAPGMINPNPAPFANTAPPLYAPPAAVAR